MNRYLALAVLLWAVLLHGISHASYPVYADGDLAPLGKPDGLINTADYLVASRIVLDHITPTDLEYAHGDLYPPGSPDGIINTQDLLLLQKRLLAPSPNTHVANLDLFVDGPATLTGQVDGNSATTTVTVNGYTGPGATVTNDPNFTDLRIRAIPYGMCRSVAVSQMPTLARLTWVPTQYWILDMTSLVEVSGSWCSISRSTASHRAPY